MLNHEIELAYRDYERYAPVLEVFDSIVVEDRTNWTADQWEAYGDHVSELAMERALGGSSTSQNDAERIYEFYRRCDALRAYARVAPMHAEAVKEVINGLWV
jgi:hypothetical protein